MSDKSQFYSDSVPVSGLINYMLDSIRDSKTEKENSNAEFCDCDGSRSLKMSERVFLTSYNRFASVYVCPKCKAMRLKVNINFTLPGSTEYNKERYPAVSALERAHRMAEIIRGLQV